MLRASLSKRDTSSTSPSLRRGGDGLGELRPVAARAAFLLTEDADRARPFELRHLILDVFVGLGLR